MKEIKLMAIAIVAMFIASGFAVINYSDSNAATESNAGNDGDVAIYDASGQQVDTYTTLTGALAAVEENQTIKLLKNLSGNGIGIFNSGDNVVILDENTPKQMRTNNVVIDFDNRTYTVNGGLVGSSGTKNQAMHLESNLEMTLKNGALITTNDVNARFIIQNYCNLTLDNFTLDGKNLTSERSTYVLSNNNGTITVSGCSNILSKDGASSHAFDLCHYANYGNVTVTFDETFRGIVDGNVEISETSPSDNKALTLNISGRGTFKGNLVNTLNQSKTTFNGQYDSGYFNGEGWGETGLVGDDIAYASIGEEEYPSIASALLFANPDSTIKALRDDDNGAGLFVEKKLTIDFDGYTYRVTTPTVGSKGYETQAIHTETNVKFVLMNGTLVSDTAKMLVQTHGNTTISDMVLDGSNLVQGTSGGSPVDVYTLSTNNGTVVVNNSTIIAKTGELEGGKKAFAFDVCVGTNQTECTVKLIGKNSIEGNVELTTANESLSPILSIEGETELSGNLESSVESHKVVLEENGVLDVKEDHVLNCNFYLDDSGTDSAEVTKVKAGTDGISVSHGSILISGSFERVDNESKITIGTDDVKMEGNVGNGVTISIENSKQVTLVGELTFEEGSTLAGAVEGSFISLEGQTFDVVMKKGSTFGEEQVDEDRYIKVDDAGETTEVFRTFFVNAEHVTGYTYDGKDVKFCDFEKDQSIDLSKLKAKTENGYKVTGYKIGDKTYSLSDSVKIDKTCDITSIVEKDSNGPNIGLIVGGIVAAIAVIGVGVYYFVFYKKP